MSRLSPPTGSFPRKWPALFPAADPPPPFRAHAPDLRTIPLAAVAASLTALKAHELGEDLSKLAVGTQKGAKSGAALDRAGYESVSRPEPRSYTRGPDPERPGFRTAARNSHTLPNPRTLLRPARTPRRVRRTAGASPSRRSARANFCSSTSPSRKRSCSSCGRSIRRRLAPPIGRTSCRKDLIVTTPRVRRAGTLAASTEVSFVAGEVILGGQRSVAELLPSRRDTRLFSQPRSVSAANSLHSPTTSAGALALSRRTGGAPQSFLA